MVPTISALIASSDAGDRSAANTLFSLLYAELHELARRQLAGSGPALGLGPTTLLHDAYVNIVAREGTAFPDRARFMGYAARVMRGLIVDHVRARAAQKRGGAFRLVTLSDEVEGSPAEADDAEVLQVDEVLEELAAADPGLAEVVNLKFFCGFTLAEVGALRGVSERTIQRQWDKARIFLRRRIREKTT